jgi:hypothetical protein
MDAIIFFEKSGQILFGQEKIINFESKLLLNKSRLKNFKGYLKWSIIEGILLMSTTMIGASQILQNKTELYLLCGAIGFATPFGINYLFQDILFEKRKRKREELLSDLLLEASVFCDENSADHIIRKLSEFDFPLLKEDFSRAYQEIQNGASIEEALTRIKELNQSKAFSRVIDLFIQGYKSGAKLSEIMKDTAEDLLETKAILKERQAVMLVTKYTLIIAAGMIVPTILGLIIGLVSGMNFDAMEGLSLGLSVEQRKALFQSAIYGTTFYVIEYAGISSFFLALQEGNKKQFWIYALILTPIAILTFVTAKAMH